MHFNNYARLALSILNSRMFYLRQYAPQLLADPAIAAVMEMSAYHSSRKSRPYGLLGMLNPKRKTHLDQVKAYINNLRDFINLPQIKDSPYLYQSYSRVIEYLVLASYAIKKVCYAEPVTFEDEYKSHSVSEFLQYALEAKQNIMDTFHPDASPIIEWAKLNVQNAQRLFLSQGKYLFCDEIASILLAHEYESEENIEKLMSALKVHKAVVEQLFDHEPFLDDIAMSDTLRTKFYDICDELKLRSTLSSDIEESSSGELDSSDDSDLDSQSIAHPFYRSASI